MAITNCLNFGNPTRPEVFFQLREAIGGMAEACTALETPVTGGNVSLYNESPAGAVYPTSVIGMVGLIEDVSHITPATFRREGASVLLLGEMGGELGGSEYLATIHDRVVGKPPSCDVNREKAVIDALLQAIRAGAVSSAHDCSDGGLAVALAECCISNREQQQGADIDLSQWRHTPNRALLFGESQARIIVSSSEPEQVAAIAKKFGVPCTKLGFVGTATDALAIRVGNTAIRCSLDELARAYHDAIPAIMSRTPEHVAFDETEQVVGH
jgi:phosphoribosylformylglycinamidine synthase